MRLSRLYWLALAVLTPLDTSAQPAAPNDLGVTMGHWDINTADVAGTRRLFQTLGGAPMRVDDMEVVRFPGVDVYLHPRTPIAGSVGSAVNHVGFLVRDIKGAESRWTAAGVKVDPGTAGRADQRWIMTSDQLRIEILEDPSITEPIRHHHVHFFIEAARVPEIQEWYVKMFGAKPGVRANFQAADIPGANLTFTGADAATAPTRGRALDHITIRVQNVEAFAKKLEAEGIELDRPVARNARTGVVTAFFTDRFGTYIQLQEN